MSKLRDAWLKLVGVVTVLLDVLWPEPLGLETGAQERTNGILGLIWSASVFFSRDAQVPAYLAFAIPLFIISGAKLVFAYTRFLVLRVIIAFFALGYWLSVTVVAVLLTQQVWNLRSIILYAWLAALAGYDLVQLGHRLFEMRHPTEVKEGTE